MLLIILNIVTSLKRNSHLLLTTDTPSPVTSVILYQRTSSTYRQNLDLYQQYSSRAFDKYALDISSGAFSL